MSSLADDLRKKVLGEVKEDRMTKHIYSTDASIFEMTPEIVLLPRNEWDVLESVEWAKKHAKKIVARGGATGIAGGCLGDGLILDLSKYCNKILDYNLQERWAVCEVGITQDEFNAFFLPYGLRLGPETSTSNRATIGGMCATNAAGHHYLKYGNMLDHVLAVEMVLSNGEKRWFGPDFPFLPLAEIEIAAKTSDFTTRHRSSSGYLISSLLENPVNPAKLLVGSEGTLGIFTKLKVRLSPLLPASPLVLFSFSSMKEALEKVNDILPFKPLSLELLDHHVISFGKMSPAIKGKLEWLKDDPEAMLVADFGEEIPSIFSNRPVLKEEKEKTGYWALRKGGLGLLLSRRSYSRAIAFIEDFSLPPHELATFVEKLKKLIGRDMGIYGHAGDGCLHIRPFVDLTSESDKEWIFKAQKQAAILVREHGGVLSGEHGDGLIRSWLNKMFFGSETYSLFKKIKQAFDPLNLMNPHKIVDGENPKPFLKQHAVAPFPTFLNFEKEGGFSLSVDLCNGNGECRKKRGLMCPSFHAYGDERHTTRARAQVLRSMLLGRTPLNEDVLDVLDYCLECKGCKTECPSQIDMAKMKMEMLFQYQEKHGYSLLNRLFGNLPTLSKIASLAPGLSNWLIDQRLIKSLLSSFGISQERSFPPLAKKRFSTWFKSKTPSKGEKKLVLFADTFTEYYSPEIGIAATEVLEKCGYEVELIPPICCGRTYLSKGMLKKAKAQAFKLAGLISKIKKPLVVLEPSCLSALKEDYKGLIGKSLDAFPLEAFLPELPEIKDKNFFYHPHCHEQALADSKKTFSLFAKNNFSYSHAGCCGLAGSFGYETKHYPMSMAIGEKILFPQIRNLPLGTFLIASGFSCRCQIEHGTNRQAQHPAVIFNKLLK